MESTDNAAQTKHISFEEADKDFKKWVKQPDIKQILTQIGKAYAEQDIIEKDFEVTAPSIGDCHAFYVLTEPKIYDRKNGGYEQIAIHIQVYPNMAKDGQLCVAAKHKYWNLAKQLRKNGISVGNESDAYCGPVFNQTFVDSDAKSLKELLEKSSDELRYSINMRKHKLSEIA